MSRVAADILATGRVHGVGFRYFVMQRGRAYNLSGWVMNKPDGSIAVRAEGEKKDIKLLVAEIKVGPSLADVSEVSVIWSDSLSSRAGFEVKY